MTVLRTTINSTLPPADVLRVLTDFGPARAKAWPNVDAEHLQVHDSGPNWADVTEGVEGNWERERYEWDAAAGTVSAVTTDASLWGPGSRWDYQLTPQAQGTRVDITLQRFGKGLKGRVFGALLPLVGKKVIGASFAGPLKVAGADTAR